VKNQKQINKWKDYLWKDAVDGAFDLGATVAYLKICGSIYWVEASRLIFNLPEEKEKLKFKDQLQNLLEKKFNEMSSLKISKPVFSKMGNEMHTLLLCSLASQRSPDEIIDGLENDPEMREEVINLLISKVKRKTSQEHQRIFFDKIFSGDVGLRKLLNEQTEKKGFPYGI
jgi:hypothetical protein